jgi:hypothetical protein
MALPESAIENRTKNRAAIKAVLRERELYPWRFSDAGARYARGESHGGAGQWQPSGSGEMVPDIPDFLKRTPDREHDGAGASLVEVA